VKIHIAMHKHVDSTDLGGGEKSHNLTRSNSSEERFKVLHCENKVDGTQKLTYNGKIIPKVYEPTI